METKESNRQRSLLMLGGVAVAVIALVIIATIKTREEGDRKEPQDQDYNSTLPTAQVEEVTDDKFEAMRREQSRREREQDELEGSSFGLLNGSTQQSQGIKTKTEMEAYSQELQQQEDAHQQRLEAEREELEKRREKLATARSNVATPTKQTNGVKSFDVEEARSRNRQIAMNKLNTLQGKQMSEPAEEKVEEAPVIAAAKTPKQKQKKGFNTVTATAKGMTHDIRAVVHDTHKNLTTNSQVKLRLLDDMVIDGVKIPKSNFIYGRVSFSEGRLQITIDNINYRDNVLPFRGEIYDKDGGRGIYVPDNAISETKKDVEGRNISGTDTKITSTSGGLAQRGINGMNTTIDAVKNAVQKKATENKVSISANYNVTIREKK